MMRPGSSDRPKRLIRSPDWSSATMRVPAQIRSMSAAATPAGTTTTAQSIRNDHMISASSPPFVRLGPRSYFGAPRALEAEGASGLPGAHGAELRGTPGRDDDAVGTHPYLITVQPVI